MPNARTIIEAAYRKITVLGEGQTLSASEAEDGLELLNDMIEMWSIDGGLVFTQDKESFPLQVGKVDYTIGSGGDFNTTRPVDLKAAFVRWGGYDYTLSIEDEESYAQNYDKDIPTVPSYIYYDQNHPLGTIYLWGAPNQAMDLHLYTRKELSSFPDLTTNVSLAPGYSIALKTNLAVMAAPEFGKQASPRLETDAMQTKAILKTYNTKQESFKANLDHAILRRTYNINNGVFS